MHRVEDEPDVDQLYSRFEPLLMESIAEYASPLPGVVETVRMLRLKGLKIGSTTGYTDSMMALVAEVAMAKGYSPDIWVTPDSTSSCGRPRPYMIFKNMEALRLSSTWSVVKLGDTITDIKRISLS
ncbi:bifunctional phosphonoacetaldehyde hydrolase/aminoethylphosphonate transaminase [Peptoclostridium acidaminophilum DSM 3953]|uniref:Bifunctional phosphonoacetaldehyde hydrolase/aminoethylphosphonate transaminase n=1 Tax=Peptoclostridium acidaminophilum DSM 3953 TaxID=1286171 RepID=W8T918_PEPAC|nr:HAD family hydrolase [Peptoclostridium acidaminophilum]AHM57405.1 bifunctional phosphonoacetaldehyde hydrolase/aminoethylphosphonate transaminase [Peptoclostridium acidaminophilum DSM 3953]